MSQVPTISLTEVILILPGSLLSILLAIAIVEHDLRLNRSTFDVLRILGLSLFDKSPIRELFEKTEPVFEISNEGHVQLCLNF